MNKELSKLDRDHSSQSLMSEFLILPDGQVLAHNLSPVMAEVLKNLNPMDETIKRRAGGKPLSESRSSRDDVAQIKNKLETPHVVSYNSEHHP